MCGVNCNNWLIQGVRYYDCNFIRFVNNRGNIVVFYEAYVSYLNGVESGIMKHRMLIVASA